MIYSLDFYQSANSDPNPFYAKAYNNVDEWKADVDNNTNGIVTKYGYFKSLDEITTLANDHNAMLNSDPPKLFIHTCRDCGAPYVIYQSELDYMTDRGFKPPKRCFVCRRLRKTATTQCNLEV